jgi:signal transduction histidine kinase
MSAPPITAAKAPPEVFVEAPFELEEIERALSVSERVAIAKFERRRRLNLLRIITPILLALSALSFPNSVYIDVQSAVLNTPGFHFYGTMQGAIGLTFLALGYYFTRQERVAAATSTLLIGISVNLIWLIIVDTYLPGPLDLRSVFDFTLLVIPILLIGFLGDLRALAAVTAGTVGITLWFILYAPHAVILAETLKQSDGEVVFAIPVALQIVTGLIVLAVSQGLRRTQRELNTTRILYARERELDRAKDRLISNINHELRTPIMSVQGYLVLAREMSDRGDELRERQMLDRSIEALHNLSDLVESVLRVRQAEFGIEQMEIEPVNIRDIVHKVVTLLDPRESGNVERPLELRLPSDLQVMANPERLGQVLLNLISNACKYSPPGSPVTISAQTLPALSPRGRGKQRPPMVRIAVRDRGLGIPPDQMPLLFKRFVRLERDVASRVTGTGLGLAICRTAIEAMGGKIWAESAGVPGDGTTFYFTLPLASRATAL